MDLTGGTRATAVAGAAVLLGGIAIILYGIIHADVARSVSGACLTMPALTLIALVVVRRWIIDVRDERRSIAAEWQEAESEKARYLAARANLGVERDRLRQALKAERALLVEQFKAERQAMEDEFARERGEASAEAMNIMASWVHQGRIRPPERKAGNLIRFPNQETSEPTRSRERAREH